MANEFIIKNGFHSKGDSQVTGSLTATSFVGDGSELTNLPSSSPFPLNGNALITGSLTVSSSFADFSGLTDIKTRKAAITSDHVSGQIVTSASFYNSFVDALNAVNPGETIHLLSNDSSSLVGDAFSNISCSIQGNGFTFSFVAAPANYYTRFQFTSCSLDMYDFTLERNPPSNVSGYTWGAMQLKRCAFNLYNSTLKTSGNTSILLEGDNNYIRGGRIDSDNTSDSVYNLRTLTYGADDNTIDGVDFYTDQGAGLYVQGERAIVKNCTITAQNNGLNVNGHTASILDCTVNTHDGTALTYGIGLYAPNGGAPVTHNTFVGAGLIQGCTVYSGQISVANDVYANIADCSTYSDGGYYGIQHLGTGSIKDCIAKVEGTNSNYGRAIYTVGAKDMVIENCTGEGYRTGIDCDGNVKIINSIGATHGGDGGVYIQNGNGIFLNNVTGIARGNTQTAAINISISSSANGEKNFIQNLKGVNYQTSGVGSYENTFVITGAPDSDILLKNISAVYHNTSGDAGTSTGMKISGLTGSMVDGIYSEGGQYGAQISAISSSISNGTIIQKKETGGYSGNQAVGLLRGNKNTYNNIHFQNYNDTGTNKAVVLIENTQSFHSCTFEAFAPTQWSFSGSGQASVELIDNIYQITDLAYITASNVSNDTTGYIDGRGNWHRSQVTSSFDHIEATTFKGDGSGLSNLPASSTFPFIGDTQITGSLIVSGSLHAFTLDSDSVILGKDAGKHATSNAENNVIIGVSAGISASNDNNVLIGKQAGEQVTGDGSDNIFIGLQAGQKGADKQENVAIGRSAHTGYATSDTSDGNVSIGYYAGRLFQNSNLNIAIGYYAGHGNGSGGSSALRNVFLGAYAGYNHWNGIQDNIYVGYYAGAFNQQGDRNIIIGSGSTANGNPSDQLRIGHSTLHVISGSLATGDLIFASTASAAYFVGDGSQLTNLPASDPFPFIGDAQITGSLTISGSFEAFKLDADDIVLGSGAGEGMTSSDQNNIIIGTKAVGSGNIDGIVDTIAIGHAAGENLTTGDNNILIGSGSGAILTTGYENIMIGDQTNASTNSTYMAIVIGQAASVTSGTGAIAIGRNSVSNSNSVAIGSGANTNSTQTVTIGQAADSNAARGIALGQSARQDGYGGIAIGYTVTSNAGTGVAIGYNFSNTLASSFQWGATNQKFTVTTNTNVLLNNLVDPTAATHFDDSATNVITIGTGSAPDANVAHSVQLYAQTGSSEAGLQLRTSGGKIHTLADKVDFTTATAISGSTFSGSFVGDGSNLTGISSDPFPFTGDAQITGSLVISASNNTSESLSIEGSGSTIFSIQGSQGQLFSVTDDLLDEVFSVADISGDTLLSVSGSGLVEIPVGNLSGSATSTASFGHYLGDGSQLTNLPQNFTAAGISGSSTELSSSLANRLTQGNENISTWTLGASGTDHYTFSGPGLTGAENDPDIYLVRGQKYRFYNNSGGHPFRIQSTPNGSAGTAYNDGVTNNDAGNGEYLLFDVQFDAPIKLYYQCTSHGDMGGPIHITDQETFTSITASGDISASGGSIIGDNFANNNPGVGVNKIAMSVTNRIDLSPNNSTAIRLSDSLVNLNKDTEVNGDIDITGKALITGSLNVTGSIGMALPSASNFKSYGVPGYSKIIIPYSTDNIFFQDENLYLEYNDAGTDQLEARILTDPSSGTVDFTYTNNTFEYGELTVLQKNVSDGEFDIDASFVNWEKATLEIFSISDSSYPTYHVTFTSADNVKGVAIIQKFI